MNGRVRRNPPLVALILAGALVAASFAAPAARAQALLAAAGVPTLAPMLAEVTPAVVNISTVAPSPAESNPMFRDPFFRRFFDVPEQQQRQERAAGSGVIVDAKNGYVMTNNHVIRGAKEVVVTLKDRRTFKARLIGTDPGTDIAVLKIEATDLKALRFGDSDQLQVGDFVVAIGNPFGIGQTVTSGIVSALSRTGLSMEGYEDFIQTDASINPGNSGGALVSLKGELVGINTAIIGPAGGNVGIGFAVPTAMARVVMEQIIRFGEVRRGKLGIETAELTPELAKTLNIPVSEGAVVAGVEPGQAADKAGLRRGDVIVGANGRPVRGSADLRNKVGLIPIGEEVELRYLREGRQQTTRARVGQPFTLAQVDGQAVPELSGASVTNIERGMPLFGRIEGVIVAKVEQNAPAWQQGLRPGDVIYGVNRRRIRNVNEFMQVVRAAQNQLSLLLVRGDYRITILIR